MRTTIDLSDPLFRSLKMRAASEGVSMKVVLSRILEAGLQAPAAERQAAQTRPAPPSFRVGNPLPRGLSNARLCELLDEADDETPS